MSIFNIDFLELPGRLVAYRFGICPFSKAASRNVFSFKEKNVVSEQPSKRRSRNQWLWWFVVIDVVAVIADTTTIYDWLFNTLT